MFHPHYIRSGASGHRLYFFMMPTASSFPLVIRMLPSAIKSSLVDADTFSQLASEPWEEERSKRSGQTPKSIFNLHGSLVAENHQSDDHNHFSSLDGNL